MPYIVQINSAQCRPSDDSGDQFKNKGIYEQCLPFKERELEIARPEIVWLQGAPPGNYFWPKLRTFGDEVMRELRQNTVLDTTRLTVLLENYIRRLDGSSYTAIVVRTAFPGTRGHYCGIYWPAFKRDVMLDTATLAIELYRLLSSR